MNLECLLKTYQDRYDILAVVNLDDWYSYSISEQCSWLQLQVQSMYRDVFETEQRVIFTLSHDEYASQDAPAGEILTALQEALNIVDISNFLL